MCPRVIARRETFELRLGTRPAWIDEALAVWPEYRDQKLPEWGKSY